MRMRMLAALSLLAASGCSGGDSDLPPRGGAPANVAPAGVVVFEGARLIPGDGSAPIADAAFVVRDGRFTAVGPRGQVTVPEGATRVDLSGKTVMPALVDTHKHLSSDRAELIDQLEQLAYWGVGAAMSLGQDDGDVPFQVRAETIPGAARFRTAGRGITTPEPGRSEVPYWVTTEEQGRTAVRELAERQVDIVKVWVDDRNGQYEKVSAPLYTAVIDEAHRNDLRVTAHIFSLDDAKGLLRAGIDAFAHGIRDTDVDDEAVQLFRERPGVVLVPNLPGRGVATDLSWLAGAIPAAELAELQAGAIDNPGAQQSFGIQARNLDRLNDAGVRIAFGTDGPTPWAAHLELEDMVASGMTPAEAIVAATWTSAEFMRLEDMGAIETGRSADFLVLDADPLADITNTRRIAAVWLRGEEVDREGLRARWMGGGAR